MNVFKIHQGIRNVGLNYGLPVWFIDFGPGVGYKPEELLRRIAESGAKKKDWIVLREGVHERGIGIFVDGLKYISLHVEMEACGNDETPSWYTKADRWLVKWTAQSLFNYGAMRGKVDLLWCDLHEIDKFLKATQKLEIDKAVIISASDIANVGREHRDMVFQNNLHVYRKE